MSITDEHGHGLHITGFDGEGNFSVHDEPRYIIWSELDWSGLHYKAAWYQFLIDHELSNNEQKPMHVTINAVNKGYADATLGYHLEKNPPPKHITVEIVQRAGDWWKPDYWPV